MTKSKHRTHPVCHVTSINVISTASTRMKHVKCQTSLPKGGFQWKLACGQDPINFPKPAFGTRSSLQQTAANLPRVFHTRSKEGLHTNQRDPVGTSLPTVLKLDSIWETMPETFLNREQRSNHFLPERQGTHLIS